MCTTSSVAEHQEYVLQETQYLDHLKQVSFMKQVSFYTIYNFDNSIDKYLIDCSTSLTFILSTLMKWEARIYYVRF